MLFEGSIKQPSSMEPIDRNDDAFQSLSPDPVPNVLQHKCSRQSVPKKTSYMQSCRLHSHWMLPQNQVRPCLQDFISKLFILTAYFVSSLPLPSSTSAPVRALMSISARPTSTSQLRWKCIHSRLSQLVFISLLVITIASGSVHCLNSHSESESSQESDTPPNIFNHVQRQKLEKHFLKMLGIESKPQLPPNQKVTEYLLDLFFTYRNRQREWKEEQTESDAGGSHRFPGLTTENLWDVNNSRDESELEEDEVLVRQKIKSHHRAPSKWRPSQDPRVTLKGPAKTIIVHKLDDHNDGTINRRRRSTESTLPQSKTPSEEMLLIFDIDYPDQFLMGGELRLYLHSVYDLGNSSNQSVINNETVHWPLNPWNVRYRSGSPTVQSSSGSSGEKYSGKQPDHQYLQRINVYYLLRPLEELQTSTGQTNRTSPFTKLIDTQVIDVRASGWLSFDIYPAIDRWLKHPNKNFGLLITMTDSEGRQPSRHSNLVVVNQQESHMKSTSQPEKDSAWQEVQPFVVTFFNKEDQKQDLLQSKSSRVKRAASTRNNSRPPRKQSRKNNLRPSGTHVRDECSRKQLTIYFEIFGWDFIIGPTSIEIFYCQGECRYPFANHLNFTYHATVQALVNSVNKAVVPAPCCVPTDLSPHYFVTIDPNGKQSILNYLDVVVEGCGCR